MRRTIPTLLALLLGTAVAHADETINGAGATFPYPVYAAWAHTYHKQTGIRLNYQSIGSGGGVRQIANRTVDFGASDAPLTPEELDAKRLYQFPAIIGGVVPVINVEGVASGQLKLTGEALCGIYLGEITRWNNPAIAKHNPDLRLPDARIAVVRRSDGSGTTAIFTHYLADVCPRWQERVGVGKAVKWPGRTIGGKGNEGVANYVRRTRNSIGYVEFAYAQQNKLTTVQLRNAAGNFVAPSAEAFANAAASANFDPARHFHLWMTNAPGAQAWPIAGASFILLARERTDANRKVVAFFDWAFVNGDDLARRLHYVPLPEALVGKVRAYWRKHGLR